MVLSFVTKWFERKVKIINISSIVEYVWNTDAFKVRQEMDVYTRGYHMRQVSFAPLSRYVCDRYVERFDKRVFPIYKIVQFEYEN